jgi:hypothetical protein
MNKNSEPDPAVEADYSMEEAKEMGAFVEDALSFQRCGTGIIRTVCRGLSGR